MRAVLPNLSDELAARRVAAVHAGFFGWSAVCLGHGVVMAPPAGDSSGRQRLLGRWQEASSDIASQLEAEQWTWACSWGLLRAREAVTYLGCDLHPELPWNRNDGHQMAKKEAGDGSSGRSEEPLRPLAELAVVDREAERVQQSLGALRECIDAGLQCVRAAQTVIRDHSSWRGFASRAFARHLVGPDPVEQIATVTAVADEKVAILLALYVEGAKPLQVLLEVQTSTLETIEARRRMLMEALPSELAARYELLRQTTRHPYICVVSAGRCTGCNLLLPTAFAQELARGRTDSCPSCGRILCTPLARG